MSTLIHCPPGTPFVAFLRDTLLDAIRDNKRTRVILPAGDVCRLARAATEQHPRILIYSLDEAANTFGKHAPLKGLKPLSPACGRFLVNAFLEKAGVAAGEKAAPRFYRLLSETERLFGDPARLADAAEASGFHEQCGEGAALFLMLCRFWNSVVTEAGYISPAASRAARIDYWLNETPPNPVLERLVAAYMPVADHAVQTLCRFVAHTDDGMVFCQGSALPDDVGAHTPDHPDHYLQTARRIIETADMHEVNAPVTAPTAAPLWFAPATALPRQLNPERLAHANLPQARIYPDTLLEQEANAAQLQQSAAACHTAALVTQDAQAAHAVAAILSGNGIAHVSAFDTPDELTRFNACVEACFAYAAPRKRLPRASLLQLCRAPFPCVDEDMRRRVIALINAVMISAGKEAGAEAITGIPELLRAPSWPEDATEETALLQRFEHALQSLKQAAVGAASPAFMWHSGFTHALALCEGILPEKEDNIPTPEKATEFLNAPGLNALPLSAERALSLLKEACTACFSVQDISLAPGVPLICRAEHVRLLEPDTLIFSGLTEDGFDRSDTDAYLGKLPEEARLLSAEARIARRSAELLAGLSAAQPIYTCSQSRSGSALRPSRAMARLLLLHKAAGTAPYVFTPQTLPCPADIPPRATPSAGLRADIAATPLHATALETAFANPYIFYARNMLKLYEASHDDDDKPHAEFGSMLHEAADAYHRQRDYNQHDAYAFQRCVRQAAENRRLRLGNAVVRAFISGALAMEDAFLRDTDHYYDLYPCVATETAHRITVSYDAQASVTVQARLDRCAVDSARTRILITDIKTGNMPSKKDMTEGRKTQLPLQALTTVTAYPDAARTLRAVSYRPDGAFDETTLNEQECADVVTTAASAVTAVAAHFFSRHDSAFPFTREIPYRDAYHHLARYDGWRYAYASSVI